MAKHPPAYQYYPADFEGGTKHWTIAEVGAYQRLLNHQWMNGPLPEKRLWRIAGATSDEWREVWPTVSEKFTETPEGLVNLRLEAVREEQVAYRERRAKAGHLGGIAKAKAEQGRSNARALNKQSSGKGVALQSSSSSSSSSSDSTSKKKTRAKTDSRMTGFDEFWSVYPKKKSKLDAQKAWGQMAKQRPDNGALVLAITNQIKWRLNLKKSGEFCPEMPYPATWLRAGAWYDEADAPSAALNESTLKLYRAMKARGEI